MLTKTISFYDLGDWQIGINQHPIGPFETINKFRLFKVRKDGIYLYLSVSSETLNLIDEGDRFTATYHHLKITMTIRRIKILPKLKLESNLPPTMVIKLIGKPVIQWL